MQHRKTQWSSAAQSPGATAGAVRRLVKDAQKQARVLARDDEYRSNACDARQHPGPGNEGSPAARQAERDM